MIGFAKRHEIGIVVVVVFNKNSLILKANDRDLVLIVLEEGADGYSVCRASAMLLSRRRCFTPIEALNRPCGQMYWDQAIRES